MKKSKWLHIIAGKTAHQHIREHGIRADDFRVIPAAAGGPKWISLYGLDQYLFSEFFTEHHPGLQLIGASAGAWRMVCAMMKDPREALERFLDSYTNQRYDTWPTKQKVKQELHHILEVVLRKQGVDHILNHNRHQLHVITSKGNFNADSDQKLKQKLFGTFCKNFISRARGGKDFDRYIFSSGKMNFSLEDNQGFQTYLEPLSKDNLMPVLRATGSIPVLVDPEVGIVSNDDQHWDGGIIDYHPALQYKSDGLILYPHFYPYLKKGWFDKYLFWRKASKEDLDKTLIIAPSKVFIDTLPNQKLPDRKDFEHYMGAHDDRVNAWYAVAEKSKILAEEFHEIVTKQSFEDYIIDTNII